LQDGIKAMLADVTILTPLHEYGGTLKIKLRNIAKVECGTFEN